MSVPMLEKSKTISDDQEGLQLIEEIVNLASALRTAGEENKKVNALKGFEELIQRIDEVLAEIQEQHKKVILAMKTSSRVIVDLSILKTTMKEIEEFFGTVTKAWLLVSKGRLKLRMQNLYQSLRARCTQLMTAVSLELLTEKDTKLPHVANELYILGIAYYYGITGKPKNYTYAFEKFIQAAEFGDEESMIMTAKCYLKGYGVEENHDAGLLWLEKALELNHLPHVKTEIALLIIEQLKNKNYHAIRDYLEYALSAGANDSIGFDNLNNDNSKKNSSKMIPSIESTHTVKRTYTQDNEHSNQDEKADEEDADNNNNSNSLIAIDSDRAWQGKDLGYALHLLLQAASEGHIEARTHLGIIYEEGKDYEQAAKWYSSASNGGCSKGTYKLADLLLNKKSTFFGSRAKAFSLFAMAAKNGEIDAYDGLGLCYENGIGTDPNLDLALLNYRKGAKGGSGKAQYDLGYLLIKKALEVQESIKKLQIKPTHERIDEQDISLDTSNKSIEKLAIYRELKAELDERFREGIHWLRSAAEHFYTDAFYQLGLLYEQGIGLPQDLDAALRHFLFASDHGHARSAFAAANILYEASQPYELNMTKVASLYLQAARDQNHSASAKAMNSYALLAEDGRAFEDGHRDIYTAAAWYFQACKLEYAPAFLNLALLLSAETIYSFQSLDGEMITLPKALRFLESTLPIDLDSERALTYETLIDSIAKRSSNAVPVVIAGQDPEDMIPPDKAPRLQQPNFESKVNYPSDQQSQSQHASFSYSKDRMRDSYDAGSLVLIDSNVNNNVPSNRMSLSSIPSLRKSTDSKRDSYWNLAKDQSNSPYQHYHSLSRDKRKVGFRDSPSPTKDRQIEIIEDYPSVISKPSPHSSYQQNQQPQQRFSQQFSQQQPSQQQHVSIDFGESSNHELSKSGELFLTKGAIPPPLYVPKSVMHGAPSSATKPGPARLSSSFSNSANQSFNRSMDSSPDRPQYSRDVNASRPLPPVPPNANATTNLQLGQLEGKIATESAITPQNVKRDVKQDAKRDSLGGYNLWNKLYKSKANTKDQPVDTARPVDIPRQVSSASMARTISSESFSINKPELNK